MAGERVSDEKGVDGNYRCFLSLRCRIVRQWFDGILIVQWSLESIARLQLPGNRHAISLSFSLPFLSLYISFLTNDSLLFFSFFASSLFFHFLNIHMLTPHLFNHCDYLDFSLAHIPWPFSLFSTSILSLSNVNPKPMFICFLCYLILSHTSIPLYLSLSLLHPDILWLSKLSHCYPLSHSYLSHALSFLHHSMSPFFSLLYSYLHKLLWLRLFLILGLPPNVFCLHRPIFIRCCLSKFLSLF